MTVKRERRRCRTRTQKKCMSLVLDDRCAIGRFNLECDRCVQERQNKSKRIDVKGEGNGKQETWERKFGESGKEVERRTERRKAGDVGSCGPGHARSRGMAHKARARL